MSEDLEGVVESGDESVKQPEPLPEFEQQPNTPKAGTSGEINLEALMDVPVTLSVEIGRSKLPIKQLISLNQGSVVELDREVSEPLDLMVNGTLIARGEVVVVDGQFGLRLIDIVSPSERLKKLK
ncbi:MAG: flagellar motor switch protein FliN [Porticoccaceae bacterium]|nr:flagellar motor switch protein FliN [Pseudomonadales bacterium]MCP5173034.1 flagellar motor switch protein FliN [Pseudomonadales bacterium]MCP5302508.1 flagellar motor switch protein FliN [Pseudomonadales bacterium]